MSDHPTSTSLPAPPPPEGRLRRAWTHLGPGGAAKTVMVSALVHLAVVFVLLAIDHHLHPPTCVGIGWGCSPGPVFTTIIWAILVVGPAMALFLLAVGGVSLLPSRLRPQAARILVVTVVVVAAVGAALAYTLGAR